MKSFSVFYCLLYATWTEGVKIEGFEGEQVSFQCSHRLASKYNKYLCKDPCKEGEDALVTVKSGERAEWERITLVDSGDGAFTVTFSQLKMSDSGRYWCAVDRPGLDTYTEVSLTVKEATEFTTDPQTVTANKISAIPDMSTTWTYQHISSSSTLTTSVSVSSWTTNRSTASNYTNAGEHGMSISTGTTVLYAAVVGVVVLTVLVLTTRFRKRREISKPAPPQVCSNSKDLISASERELEYEYDDIDKAMQSNPEISERASTAQHIKQDPPTPLSTGAECGVPLHVYENMCCSKGTVGSRCPAADQQNSPDISPGIEALPPMISERTDRDHLGKHTDTPAAVGNAMSTKSCPSSDHSRSESGATSLWFGLDLSGII